MGFSSDHKISTLSGISLKFCLLAKSNTVFSFLEFIKPEPNYEARDQLLQKVYSRMVNFPAKWE